MNNLEPTSTAEPGEKPRALSPIAKLNDALRQTGEGGRVVVTAGIATLSRDKQAGIQVPAPPRRPTLDVATAALRLESLDRLYRRGRVTENEYTALRMGLLGSV